MGYQLEVYSLPWVKLKKKWFARPSRPKKQAVRLSDARVDEFIACVREAGVLLASLDHSSSSGQDFLERFLGKTLPEVFSEPSLRKCLIDRPVAGVAGGDIPAWGGLELTEIRKLLDQFRPTKGLSVDEESWLADLHAAFQEAREREEDLVTIYT